MSIQWMKLVGQGRAKAYGEPWSEKEMAEISKASGAEKEALIAKFRAGKVIEDKADVTEPLLEVKDENGDTQLKVETPVAKPVKKVVKKVKK